MFSLDSGVFYKECNMCNSIMPSKQFRLRTDNITRKRRPYCLPCEKVKFHRNYHINKDVIKKKSSDWALNNYELKILNTAKKTAKTKNLDFNLTIDDIKIPSHCKYLGIELTKTLGNGTVWSNCSIDRIDSSKGYIKGNVEIISRQANTMKNIATKEELVTFAKNILEIYGE